MVRRFLRLLFFALLTMLVSGQALGQPADDDGERVRTGRTEVRGPEAGGEPVTEPSVEHESAPPVDAPHVRQGRVKLPPVASGFGTYDGGWIKFTFHPSARERIEPLIADADRIRQELGERLGQTVLKSVRVDI
ncbi:MAG TPA: hypothetical protein VF103_05260, partial [Polyangiaceae bacterium]